MELAEKRRQRAGNRLALTWTLVEGARGLRDFSKVRDLKVALAVPIR